MAISYMEFWAQSLNMRTRISCILPENPHNPAILILLHGLGDDENVWLEQTRLAEYASRFQVIIIMPRVDRSYYTNTGGGVRYFNYVADELIDRCSAWFGFNPVRDKTFIAGVSMGGYGALKVALNRPKTFSGCYVLSGVTDLGDQWDRNPDRNAWYDELFGSRSKFIGTSNDLIYLTKHFPKGEAHPFIYQFCGRNDSLYQMNFKYQQLAQKAGFNTLLKTVSGAHEWSLWDKGILEVLKSIELRIE